MKKINANRGDADKKPTLPNAEFLSKYGIAADSIRYSSPTDLDGDANYRRGFLLLAENMLYIFKSGEPTRDMHFEANEPLHITGEPQVDIIQISSISAISVETKIASVTVVATVDGEERLLANATNRCSAEVRKLVRDIERKLGKASAEPRREGRCDMPQMPPAHPIGGPGGPGRRMGPPPAKTKLAVMKSGSLFKRLMGFFASYKSSVAAVLLCFAATSVISLVSPYLSGEVLYGQVLDGKLENVPWLPQDSAATALLVLVAVMIGVKLLTQAFNMLHSYVTAKFVPKVIRDIKNKIFDSMNNLSLSFFQSRETGTLMTRVLDDADQVTALFIDMLPATIVAAVTIIVAVIIMFSVDIILAAVAVILLPASAIISAFLMSKLWTIHGRLHRANRKLSSAVNDNIVGARVVRAFGKQQSEVTRFGSTNAAVRDVQVDIVNMQSRLTAVFSFINGLVPLLVMGAAGYLILNRIGDMDYAKYITFTGYVGMLSGPFESVSNFLREWPNCMNSTQRIFEIIDAKPEVAENVHPVHLENIKGDVELKDVCFAYDKGNPVLTDVSFSVENGKMLGIVGRSGAGKSTLLNLITRLYDVGEGQVLIDGVDIRDIAISDLRGLVALVSQETYIFMGTVAENIAYACPNATPADIVNAAKAACAHDFIMKLPDGYDTVIGTAGRQLSGGERQRLSIARAVLVNPRILMLDEATAAVDTETEINIQLALEQLIKGRTTISVAHRLSTLRNADELIVIENGKIAERGTHDELMEKQGIYFKLAEIQRKALEYRSIGG